MSRLISKKVEPSKDRTGRHVHAERQFAVKKPGDNLLVQLDQVDGR